MSNEKNCKGYHIKHRRNFKDALIKAKEVADFAVQNKHMKFISTKLVKHIDLPSTIKCQILRKYGNSKTIKEATNVGLIIPNSSIKTYTNKDGVVKKYGNIMYENGIVTLKPLKISFRWNPGREIIKINQVEIDNRRFMVTATFKDNPTTQEFHDILGIDLNCGFGRHIVNMANLKTHEVVNLGKRGPKIRKKYAKKRQIKNQSKKQRIRGNKEQRIMRDLDHKISRKVVNYALQHKLKIVMEDLKGIRRNARRGNGSRAGNRTVNSWSFYRLQTFVEYKAKEHGIPFEKVNPHYTSQECSYCGILGKRNKDEFICKNINCCSFNTKRHADVNAAFNVGKRSLQLGSSHLNGSPW